MSNILPTIVLRHKKENLKKCSLRGLEKRDDFRFFTYPKQPLPIMNSYVMLSMDAPELSFADAEHGLFVLDATWRHAETMYRQVENHCVWIFRSIPQHYRTAYPRRQEDCTDPERGLASIEAIYIAYRLLGRSNAEGLLDNYHWKDKFLSLNADFL